MKNYLGQLRIYSLIDLFILLIAIRATNYEFIGVILLHIGFLSYLETRHKHSYRKMIPNYLWIVLSLIGSIFYWHIEGILFILFSYLYTKKNIGYLATFSPIARGLQLLFLVAGIVGYINKFTLIAFILLSIRNLCGDLRDVVKDRSENMKTLPIILGFEHNIKHIHLVATLATTFIWFQYTDLNYLYLVPIFLIQILTYNLTPR